MIFSVANILRERGGVVFLEHPPSAKEFREPYLFLGKSCSDSPVEFFHQTDRFVFSCARLDSPLVYQGESLDEERTIERMIAFLEKRTSYLPQRKSAAFPMYADRELEGVVRTLERTLKGTSFIYVSRVSFG